MKLNIYKDGIDIVPEVTGYPNYDERDIAFVEEVLGLKKEGDSVKLVRKNAMGLSSLAYLRTEKRSIKD